MTANGKVAGLVTQGGAVAQNVTTTPGLLVLWTTAGTVYGAKASTLHSRVQATVKGAYFVSASLSFQGGDAGDVYTVTVYKNGVATAYSASMTAESADTDYNIVVHGGLSLNGGDVVQLYVSTDNAGGSTFTLVHGQFGIWSF